MHPKPGADRLLQWSVAGWFLIVVTGQLIFAAYLAALYGGATLAGDMQGWNRIMRHGIIEGDPIGSALVVVHVALALTITLGGLVQITPHVRRAWPAFHRWNGRVYLVTAVVITLAGLVLTWTRPLTNVFSELATSLNGVLILVCAAYTVRHAIARHLAIHQRWAMRLFLLVSGVWFLRLMIFGWIGLHQAPLWVGSNFDGPAAVVFSFAATLLPVAVYEIYWRIRAFGGTGARVAMAVGLAVVSLAMAWGIAMTTIILWLPLMG